MRLRPLRLLLPIALAALLWLVAASVGMADRVYRQNVFTNSGLVVLPYADHTKISVLTYGDKPVFSRTATHGEILQIPLQSGTYTLVSDDEVAVVTADLKSYKLGTEEIKPDRFTSGVRTSVSVQDVATLKVIPVPWVADSTYASNPPSYASSHTILNNVETRFKAVIQGGTSPYQVTWDAGDGTTPVVATNVTDVYNGATALHTYSGQPIGTQLRARITVVDKAGVAASASYYMVVADPTNRVSRANRAADEALWYLHTVITRYNNYDAGGGENIYNGGHIDSRVSTSSMASICLENTGRSLPGGINLSNDPSKDPYVDDLSRLINWLTDPSILAYTDITGKQLNFASGRTLIADTHGPNGIPNNHALLCNVGTPGYEAGMQLQAIAQCGNLSAKVPNRNVEGYTYLDMVGDIVDGIQVSQGVSSYAEGGWRYSLGYGSNDSDGSPVAWICIGLRAAELVAGVSASPITKAELAVWAKYNQVGNTYGGTFYVNDYRIGGKNTHYAGGSGYTSSTYGTNAGKTGGSLVAFKLLGYDDSSPQVNGAVSFLYRNFFNPDSLFNWSSARDSYGMYNLFKGLSEVHVTTLTDPLGTNGNDLDGKALSPVNWYNTLVDFIVGPSDADLGHQYWKNSGGGVSTGAYFSSSRNGHFEPTGPHSGDWNWGSSDQNSGVNLVTAWDTAILVGTVFTPAPIAHIAHPDVSAGENYVPVQINGTPYVATFDPAGSYDVNAVAAIKHVRWDFGDGASDEYDLPTPGSIGGAVPTAAGIHPSGNQAQHHYTATGDYNLTLTVTDTAGNTGATSIVVHVVGSPYPPVAALDFTALGGSFQNGDTIGILPDGTVTIQLDGTASYNPDVNSVISPKNGNGISQFWWEWPTNPTSGYNGGVSEAPPLLDEGTSSNDANLNTGSKDGIQTYTFRFDPNNLPAAITVGVKVQSNIANVPAIPNNSTIFRQIPLKPNAQITPVSTDMSITNTAAPSPALIGQQLVYTLKVTNNGPKGAARNVVVTDNLPASLSYVGCTSDNGGVVTVNGGNISVIFAALPKGTTATITLTTAVLNSVTGGTTIADTAAVSSDASDPVSTNNQSTAMVTANYPLPVLSTISPNSALLNAAATTFSLTGSGFVPSSVATWNGASLTTTYVSATALTAVVPAASLTTAGMYTVKVHNGTPGGGDSAGVNFTVNNPAPSLNSISPVSVLAGSPNTTITLTGSSFLPGSVVQANGVSLVTTYISGTTLTAVIPASSLALAGTLGITVSNLSPGGGVSSPQTFTVNNPVPSVASLVPSSATANSSDITLTVNGANFVSTSQIRWAGASLATSYVSKTIVTAVVPYTNLTTPGSYDVTVANPTPGGGTSGALGFTVTGQAQLQIATATATRTGTAITVTLTLKNIGTLSASNCQLLTSANAKLAGAATTSTVPVTIGTIGVNMTSSPITLKFTGTAGAKALALTVTSGGQSLSASKLIIVP